MPFFRSFAYDILIGKIEGLDWRMIFLKNQNKKTNDGEGSE